MGKGLQYYCYAQMQKDAQKFFEVIPVNFGDWILDFHSEASGGFFKKPLSTPSTPLPSIKNVYSQTMTFTGQVS
ncbi:hypothetical protein SAMN06295967_1112 [Belliella buryatensis]|uniref:Uncharacterized protein n=1 Tax=Belliella buryatensis TaxID=1500549 RepID=A0A239EYK9_9BACT|nr:hypothetical protein [Belliella buryatensis]SNS49358.1 hypothetical protein SAMN06295967_1112 [Belliella buryatensis]